MKPEICAVIWNDFVPLWLYFDDAAAAIAKAADMRKRATAAGLDVARMGIRAVHLAKGSDTLEVLA